MDPGASLEHSEAKVSTVKYLSDETMQNEKGPGWFWSHRTCLVGSGPTEPPRQRHLLEQDITWTLTAAACRGATSGGAIHQSASFSPPPSSFPPPQAQQAATSAAMPVSRLRGALLADDHGELECDAPAVHAEQSRRARVVRTLIHFRSCKHNRKVWKQQPGVMRLLTLGDNKKKTTI